MNFVYKQNLYDKEIIGITAISIIGSLLTYSHSKAVAAAVALAGFLIGLFLDILAKKHGAFSFHVNECGITITSRGREACFRWADIACIREDSYGLNLVLKQGLEVPILNKMEGYQDFRSIVRRKAFEYGISLKIGN